jgi:hypothetical protein
VRTFFLLHPVRKKSKEKRQIDRFAIFVCFNTRGDQTKLIFDLKMKKKQTKLQNIAGLPGCLLF